MTVEEKRAYRREYYRKYRIKNAVRYRERRNLDYSNQKRRVAAWKLKNPNSLVRHWERAIQRKYGISSSDYERLVLSQNGVCAICGKLNVGKGGQVRRFCVDHDHSTGEVRGLLCQKCNAGLGRFGDRVELLLNAALYLEKSRP